MGVLYSIKRDVSFWKIGRIFLTDIEYRAKKIEEMTPYKTPEKVNLTSPSIPSQNPKIIPKQERIINIEDLVPRIK